MDLSALLSGLVGAVIGAVIGGLLTYFGAIKGGKVQATTWYQLDQERVKDERHYQEKQAVIERRHEWERKAFEWKYSQHVTNFRYADLVGARLQKADLSKKDVRVVIGGERIELPIDLRFADLSGADLTEAQLSGADLRFAKLHGATLDSARLNGANLAGIEGKTWEEIQAVTTHLSGTIRPDGTRNE